VALQQLELYRATLCIAIRIGPTTDTPVGLWCL